MSKLTIKKKSTDKTGVTTLAIDLTSPRGAVQSMVLQLGKGISHTITTAKNDTVPHITIKRAAPTPPKKAGILKK